MSRNSSTDKDLGLEYYEDTRGNRRARTTRGSAAARRGVRNAKYDFDNNLIGGEWAKDTFEGGMAHYRGDAFVPNQAPQSRIDRFKTANNITNEPKELMTSSGHKWSDAVKAAQADRESDQAVRADQASRLRKFRGARSKLKRQPIDSTNPQPNFGPEDYPKARKIKSASYSGSYK